jgi:flagellar hook protein FlgE
MDVIGNNIANVNTTSYKSQAAGFADILYQTTREGAGASELKAAVNTSQVGLGSKLNSIMTNISKQGSAVSTEYPLDLMINGDSFFVINNEGENSFTRDGSFNIDANGYLVTQSRGLYVMGVQGRTSIADSNELTNIKIVDRKEVVVKDANGNPMKGEDGKEITKYADVLQGQATTAAYIKGIVDSEDSNFKEEGMDVRLEVYGSDGKTYYLKFLMDNAGDEDDATFNLTLKSVSASDGTEVETTTDALNLVFDKSNGDIKTITQGNNTVNYKRNENNKNRLEGDKNLTLKFSNNAPLGEINLDMTLLSNYGSKHGSKHISTVYALKGRIDTDTTMTVDSNGVISNGSGYPEGEMNGFSFDNDGSIYATYTNGQSLKKGQIAVAEFSNATGLEKIGDNLYKASVNSGDAKIQDVTQDGGYIMSGALEGSNVDLAKEFTDMITTQRGFQANSKVITTSDEMLQILKGLKR